MTRNEVTTLFTLLTIGAFALAGCSGDGPTNGGNGGNGGGEPPTAPTNVAAEADGNSITVSWEASDGATGYTVTLDGDRLAPGAEDVGDVTEATFDGLANATTYTATVSASNDDGESGDSDPAEATTAELAFDNVLADPNLPDDAFSIGSRGSPPNFVPTAAPDGFTAFDASSLNGAEGLVMPTDGRELVNAGYAGAIEPGISMMDAWYYGWTVWATDGSDSRAATATRDTLTGTITQDMTLDAGTTWFLDGQVIVGEDCGPDGNAADCDPATLTIEPGTTVMGMSQPTDPDARASMLVVSRGSRIVADAHNDDFGGSGTCERPTDASTIVFTSDQPQGSRSRGDWGGLILNGQAPINSGDEAEGEGDSGLYGGEDEADNSGVLRGVRVEFAGDDLNTADQLNGIAFQGVGAGTTACFLQVHYNQDDGTEPFGGTVTLTHVVTSGIGDDSFDGTDGWRGFFQFGIAQQRADDADQGFEFSTNGDTPDARPASTTVVANVTLVGAGMSLGTGEIAAEGSESDVGILLREGGNYRIFNTIATGFGSSGFDVEGGQTAEWADNRYFGLSSAANEIVRLESSVLWSNVEMGDADANFTDASGDGYTLEENRQFFLSGSN